MGVIANVYNGVKTQLSTISSVKTVELFNSQYNNEIRERVTRYPATLIEFQEVVWAMSSHRAGRNVRKTVDIGNLTHQQKGKMILVIHIVYQTLKTETDSFTEIDAIVTDVYRALANLEITDCTGLQRASDEQDADHDGVVVWKTTFTLDVEEKAWNDTNIVDANIESETPITLTINQTLDIDNNSIRTGDGE